MGKLDLLFEKIDLMRKEVPISEIVKDFVKLKRVGASLGGICPFHSDRTIGSFFVNDYKGIFKCFNCGEAGDIIKFYSLKRNMHYVDAAIELTHMKGYLNGTEYDDLKKLKVDDDKKEFIEKIYTSNNIKTIENRAPIKDLNKIYSIFRSLNNSKLKEEHLNHLLNDRHLTMEEIEEDGYFSLPTRHAVKEFISKLEEEGINLELLKTTPGFFYDTKKGNYSFMTVKGGGFGIPIKDSDGNIQAIQIRRDSPDMKNGKPINKYIFFSSSFANNYDYFEGGVGTGSPIDVNYPLGMKDNSKKPCRTVFITEGKFKATAITNNFNSVALSVQGVTSWRNTIGTVNNVRDKFKNKYNLDKIIIAYDADLGFNLGVFEQAIKMGLYYEGFTEKEIYMITDLLDQNKSILNHNQDLNNKLEEFLKEKSNVYMAMWDYNLGKGIDDLIDNGHIGDIRKIEFNTMYELYKNYKLALLNLVEKDGYNKIVDIPKEIMKDVFEEVSEIYI